MGIQDMRGFFAFKLTKMRRGRLMCVLMSVLAYTFVRAQVADTSKQLIPVNVSGIKTVNGVGHLPDVKGSIVYAGKKTEVIIVDSLDANKRRSK
jgi:Fe(3+) dicitrate transport protein